MPSEPVDNKQNGRVWRKIAISCQKPEIGFQAYDTIGWRLDAMGPAWGLAERKIVWADGQIRPALSLPNGAARGVIRASGAPNDSSRSLGSLP